MHINNLELVKNFPHPLATPRTCVTDLGISKLCAAINFLTVAM